MQAQQGILHVFPPIVQLLITFKGLNKLHLVLGFYDVTVCRKNTAEFGKSKYLIVDVLQIRLINWWNTESVASWIQRRCFKVELSELTCWAFYVSLCSNWEDRTSLTQDKIRLQRELSPLICANMTCGNMTERCYLVNSLSNIPAGYLYGWKQITAQFNETTFRRRIMLKLDVAVYWHLSTLLIIRLQPCS